MGIIKEYKLYKMQELEDSEQTTDDSSELEDSDVNSNELDIDNENPDFDMSDLEDDDTGADLESDDFSDEEDPDFDMSDLEDDQENLDGQNDDEFSSEDDEENPDFDMSDLEDDEENPDQENGEDGEDNEFQGDIRNVPGACLVYKRVAEDSTYEELWVYNVGKDINNEVKIRRAILAGTDIKPQMGKSDDGTQSLKVWSIGNVQFLNIFGLPN